MKSIGVIGGAGPMATAYFIELLVKKAAVSQDQQHPRIYMQSIPDMPDRTAYILGESCESPLPLIIQAGQELQNQGADFLAIPCVTAGYFYEQIENATDIPVINLLQEIVNVFAKEEICRVGILATSGTNRCKILEKLFRERGIDTCLPSADNQLLLMDIIYKQIKAGERPDWAAFEKAADGLLAAGAQKLLLGCTELSLLRKELCYCSSPTCRELLQNKCIDSLEVLAECALNRCGIPTK